MDREGYRRLFDTICIQFGKNPGDYILNVGPYTRLPDLVDISGKDFLSVLKLYTAVRQYYRMDSRYADLFDESIIPLINKVK